MAQGLSVKKVIFGMNSIQVQNQLHNLQIAIQGKLSSLNSKQKQSMETLFYCFDLGLELFLVFDHKILLIRALCKYDSRS